MNYFPDLQQVELAAKRLKDVFVGTALHVNDNMSKEHEAQILLKREDLQAVRSYKIRGAYNKMSSLSNEELAKGVVCASAGNHAQGVALSCFKLRCSGHIFMPVTTPKQKIEQVKMFGDGFCNIILEGDSFDDAYEAAMQYAKAHRLCFVHPFDDPLVIEGQATIALEILQQNTAPIDYLILPLGGGGLAAGVSSVFSQLSPNTKCIGVEPTGAASMSLAFKEEKPTSLKQMDKFIDGAAVRKVGELNYEICKHTLERVISVDEGKVCQTMIKLYNKDALVVEPAGALALAALDQLNDEIKGKRVVCIVSGSNNDVMRMAEIKERAQLYQGLKHYFIVNFPQRAGALKTFVNDVLGPNDDITRFEYMQKHNREKGPALVGIELNRVEDLGLLKDRMAQHNINARYLNDEALLHDFLT